MKIKLEMPESLLRKINNAVLIDQVHEIEDKDIDMLHLMFLINTYSRVMSHGVRVYDGKFTWNEIVFMLQALQGVIIPNIAIDLTAVCFIESLLDYFDSYDDLVGEVESCEYAINLINKITEGENINNINIYSLLHLLKSTAINSRGASLEEYKKYIEQYLKLVEEE